MQIVFGLSAVLSILAATALWVVWLRDREQVFARDVAVWYLCTATLIVAYPVWRSQNELNQWIGYVLVVLSFALGHIFLLLGVRKFAVAKTPRPRLGYQLAAVFIPVYAMVLLTKNGVSIMGGIGIVVAVTAGVYATTKLWHRGRIERSIGLLVICSTAIGNLTLAVGGDAAAPMAASFTSFFRVALAFAFVFAALNRSAAHAERMLLRFEELSENSLQGIMVMDKQRFHYLNPAAVSMFGYSSKKDMLASDPWSSTPADEREKTIEQFETAMKGRGGNMMRELQARRLRADGQSVYMRFTAWQVEWDGHPAMQVLVSDETQKREAALELERAEEESRRIEEEHREALLQVNAELEQRVTDRTKDLAQSNADLAQANTRMEDALETLRDTQAELVQREKLASLGRMVAGIAHELNTPIGNALTVGSTIRQQVMQLKSDVETGQLKKSTLTDFLNVSGEGADMLESSLHKAHALITNFRQVAKDHTEETHALFSVSALLESMCQAIQPTYDGGEISLVFDIVSGVEMDGYPGHLTQVLTQLIDNARLHAFVGLPGGEIRLKLARENGHIVISVSDNGTGIAAEVHNKVFDPFFTTRLGGSVGLGLNTVYTTVTTKLGGNIELCGAEPHGACFTVRLPELAPDIAALH